MPRLSAFPALLALLLLACHGPQDAAAATAKPPAAETPLSLCMAANRAAVAAMADTLKAGQRRHVLNPMVVARLQAFESQLGRLRAALPRDAKSLAACETTTESLAAEAARLQVLAGDAPEQGARPVAAFTAAGPGSAAVAVAAPLPVPASAPASAAVAAAAAAGEAAEACTARASRAYNELVRTLNDAQNMSHLSAAQAARLAAMSERLGAVYATLVGPAPDLPTCERVAAQLAGERQELLRQLAPPAVATPRP